MGQFRVYQEYSNVDTPVSNIFIKNYMQDANDAQIKIYLYLLMSVNSGCECSVGDLADTFNYTEKDVVRALKYWERNEIISLMYDENKVIDGVRLLKVKEKKDVSLPPAPVVLLPRKTENDMTESSVLKEVNKEQSGKEQSAEPKTGDADTQIIKPEYSLEEVRAFKENAEYSELLFVIETYLGRPLSPANIKSVMFFCKGLEFSTDLIDYLFEYCVGRDKRDFRYIEKVAMTWKEEGVTTPKMAAKFSMKYEKYVYDIMKAVGRTTMPTKPEADLIHKWTKKYGFEMEIIQEACNRSSLQTEKNRLNYADGILTNWFEAKVHHLSDVAQLDAEHEKKKKSQVPAYKNFTQREYDFDELEKQILSN